MTPRRLLMLLILPPWAFVPDRGASAATALDEVTVRVYDAAGLDGATRAAALNLAAATLTPAGAHVWWRHCGLERHTPACESAPAPGELVLRIVRSPGQLRSRTLLPLGDAFVDLGGQSGVLATIYLDRVMLLAQAAGGTPARLLGYTIAHEIGHLLLASNAHSAHGLMRPIWSSEEVKRGRPADWMFSEQDVAAIRARLEAARIAANVWGTR